MSRLHRAFLLLAFGFVTSMNISKVQGASIQIDFDGVVVDDYLSTPLLEGLTFSGSYLIDGSVKPKELSSNSIFFVGAVRRFSFQMENGYRQIINSVHPGDFNDQAYGSHNGKKYLDIQYASDSGNTPFSYSSLSINKNFGDLGFLRNDVSFSEILSFFIPNTIPSDWAILFEGVDSQSKRDFALRGEINDIYISPVPLPAGFWLFGTALAGMGFIGHNRKKKQQDHSNLPLKTPG